MKINRPFYKIALAAFFFVAVFCPNRAFSGEESTFVPKAAQESWVDDGYPLLFSRDRAALEGIASSLRENKDALVPFASAVDFQLRKQGARYKGKLLSVKGRLLRAVYVEQPGARGYYDLWILLPDSKRNPIRAIAFEAPNGFRTDGALENAKPYPRDVQYRKEQIETLAVYYRTTAFDAGDDFYAAPTLVALDFKTTPSPTSERSEKKSTPLWLRIHRASVFVKSVLCALLICLWLVARASYKRALKRAKTKLTDARTSTKSGAAFFFAFLLVYASSYAQESTTQREEFWRVVTSADQDELALERKTTRSALDAPEAARRREIALTTLGRMKRLLTPSVLREYADDDFRATTLGEYVATPQENRAAFSRASDDSTNVCYFVGELKETREIPLNESEKENRGVEKLLRAVATLDQGGACVVYTPKVPNFEAPSGFFDAAQDSKRVAGIGLTLGSEFVDGETAPVLLSAQIAWVPTDAPLGRAGVDLASFATIPVFARDALEKATTEKERKRIARSLRFTTDDAKPFYESLAASKRLQDARAPILDASSLFLEPEKLQGRPVKLRGWARRVNLALVDDPDVRASTGVEKYWQVYFFTNDSQGAPLVLCALDLPEELEPGGGKEYRREIELDGFFYKTWAYKTAETKRDEKSGQENELWTRAPLIIGRVTKTYPEEDRRAPVDPSAVFATFALLACAWILLRRSAIRRNEGRRENEKK